MSRTRLERIFIPSIDVSRAATSETARLAAAQDIDRACREAGFFLLTEHGLGGLLEDVWNTSQSFFALPEHIKRSCRPSTGSMLGYRPPRSLRASTSSAPDSPFDLKELFSIGNDRPCQAVETTYPEYYPVNVWPDQLPAFRTALTDYFAAMRSLVGVVGRLFELALGLPDEFFAARSHDQLSMLATIHYPRLEEEPEPEQLRFGAHRDRSCFTILSTTAAGLQVQDSTGHWHDVPFEPGALIVNIGRMLSNWVSGRWTAPMHRVVLPTDTTRATEPRQSLAFFYSPDPGVNLEPLFGPAADDDHRPSSPTVADHMRSMLGLYQ
ncbi:isopenicillin N synthase family dioxygenase [Kribbella sp. NPDC004536]|uniref:isopenicillin N synthase family dioxygenase n=1 Tax=Kribbella sp. NPDC004536 TaxID=3364106 RepID=UPI0036ABFFA9